MQISPSDSAIVPNRKERDVAFQNRSIALRFAQSRVLDGIISVHASSMAELQNVLQQATINAWNAYDQVGRDLGASHRTHSEKVALLEENMTKEIGRFREACQEKLRMIRDVHLEEAHELQRSLTAKRAAELQMVEAERNDHMNDLNEIHDHSKQTLRKYFDELLATTTAQILVLEKRIAGVQNRQGFVKTEIADLEEKNKAEVQPIHELELERLHLVQEVQKVDIGIMAYRNFKESSNVLLSKTKQLKRSIKTTNAQIQKLSAERDKLVAFIKSDKDRM
jgi:cell division protein FtsB